MKSVIATATVGDRYQVVIPKAIRERIALKPRMKVEFEEKNGTIHLTAKRDVSYLDKAFKKWAGTGRSLKEDGFDSVDEYIEFMRGR